MMFRFAIDRGGTFTDIYARCPNGNIKVMKLLSVDPKNYDDAPREGIRRILESELGNDFASNKPIDSSVIEWIRMGTTVATNALLERKGEPMALAVTKGFKDILEIGNQSRPKIFDLEIKCPENLYNTVIEVDERVFLKQNVCQMSKSPDLNVKMGITGEEIEVSKPIDEEKLRLDLSEVIKKGIKSLAVALVHSYTFPEHEKVVERVAKDLGFTHITLSSQIMPMIRIVPRGHTSCCDAYLTPHIQKYINGFSSGFIGLSNVNVLFMQSDGGLTPVKDFSGSRAILSGPAGGVVGYALTVMNDLKTDDPIIGFDMGGTSTDVSRFSGTFEHTFETTTAGVTIQSPQLDINTVASGGGSVLFFRSGLFVVGPESASAFPGPVCYRNGGPLTITDANLCIGRILPEYFPKIFGPNKNEPLGKDLTKRAFEKLTHEINTFIEESSESNKIKLSVEDVAMGFIRVSNETMCRPIRSITQGKGFDTSKHILACFGGAGGQHACAVAKSLGISTVFIHRYAGILSAYGMALADVVHDETSPCAFHYDASNFFKINIRIEELRKKCVSKLISQGFNDENIKTEIFLNMRYDRTDFAIMTKLKHEVKSNDYSGDGDFESSFEEQYMREFGFIIRERKIIVDDIRVRGFGKSQSYDNYILKTSNLPPPIDTKVQCYFDEGYSETPVYLLENLFSNHILSGPCIIIDPNFTVLVEPNCVANITEKGNIKINIGKSMSKLTDASLDPIQLSIFSHRFMSIAEQMGRILQRTAISTNIKERLDFSCALFGSDGGLVSNAPHIPVHLGAMGEAVRFQLNYLSGDLKSGDVILTNHPAAGGSHLPDLTVITPVFYNDIEKPIFFVANRGHHADIGGLTPGSMPPHSTSLSQEGAAFMSFKLVKSGIFQEESLIAKLMSPKQYPGCSGTRNLNDNLSDLRAQVAANQKGIALVTDLIEEYDLNTVQSYMNYIQKNAEIAVRDMLKQIARDSLKHKLTAVDYMDDGTPIQLTIEIDGKNGTAVFDFEGTGLEVWGNCNAPRAVTYSAIIYCLRCMIGHDIPLNQGCLAPITIKIPRGSILWPSDDAAVVGGNVLTSQRITDVIFKAFEACAASQGCMNNITFGDDTVGYYETVAGGSGALSYCNGRSGVHTHMTNTRITDVEIIEKRYPVIVKKFKLRQHSGGRGKYNGGNGVIRELLFRKILVLSVLTERRVFSPYGLRGGNCGSRGRNILKYRTGRKISLGAKTAVTVNAGDIFRLETPGGGGFGSVDE